MLDSALRLLVPKQYEALAIAGAARFPDVTVRIITSPDLSETLIVRQDPGDARGSQSVVATASLCQAAKQPTIEQPGEVAARCRRSNVGPGGELGRGQRPPAHELDQHSRSTGLADQGCDDGEIRIRAHDSSIPDSKRGCFGPGRSMLPVDALCWTRA